MSGGVRFPEDGPGANDYMNLTDDDQKSIITQPSTKKSTEYGWDDDESEAWSTFRTELNALYADSIDPTKTGPGVLKLLHLKIAEIRAYDNDKEHGHHLLDKVALNGSEADCLLYNVVRGTALEATPVHHDYSVVTLTPAISVKENATGYHVIKVVNPATPDSDAIPPDIIFARLFRFIGIEQPKSLRDFDFLAKAKRGSVTSMLTGVEFDEEHRQYAYYYAVYENKDGVVGPPSAIIKVEIRLESIPK